MMVFMCDHFYIALYVWFHVARMTKDVNISILCFHPHFHLYTITPHKGICKFYLHVNDIHAAKQRGISHDNQLAPEMHFGVYKRHFASFLIISIYCSHDFMTINVMHNTIQFWNSPEEVISSMNTVSSSSVKKLFLSWQLIVLTHSGLPKVYSRNRVKEHMWSEKLLMGHPEHGLHIDTAEVDVSVITSLITLVWCQ